MQIHIYSVLPLHAEDVSPGLSSYGHSPLVSFRGVRKVRLQHSEQTWGNLRQGNVVQEAATLQKGKGQGGSKVKLCSSRV